MRCFILKSRAVEFMVEERMSGEVGKRFKREKHRLALKTETRDGEV